MLQEHVLIFLMERKIIYYIQKDFISLEGKSQIISFKGFIKNFNLIYFYLGII